MASTTQSRDAISLQIYGRKFSQLSTDAKVSVNKIWGIMDRTAKSGGDSESVLRRAANEEAIKIVKQLKEIKQNPGDEITLPKGVMADAAKVLHYHYQAVGAKKPLSKGDIKDIEREVKRVFGDVHPDVVEAVATYVSNPRGRFTGVGLKTLRNKLRSFLDAEEIAKIQDKQILSARDITISHLFDKWTHGNLSSFVKPKLEDLMERDVKALKKTQRTTIRKVPLEEIKQTVESLAVLEQYQNSPSRSMSNPIIRKAMANLGLTPDQIIGISTKEAMGEVVNQAHAFSSSRVKGHPSLGGGIRMRRNWKLHSRASSEYQGSLPKKNVHFGIGRGTTVSSVPYKHDYSSGWKWDVPRQWSSGGDSSGSSRIGEYLASEMADYSYAQAEAEYGSSGSKQRLVDVGPMRAVEHYTNLISKYAGSVTGREAGMGLSRSEHAMHLQDIAMYEHNLDLYNSRYGGYGKRLLEAGVPISVADNLMLFPTKDGYRKSKIKEAIDWYSGGLSRHETPIGVNPDEFNPFSPVNTMAGLYGEIPGKHPFMKSVQKFAGLFPNDSPAYLPGEVSSLVKDVATGKDSVSGVRRVGVVGSKSFDNKSMMNKWLKTNWSDSMLMITSTEVGKTAVSGENIGAAFQASNWAHFNEFLQYKFPTRSANVGGKNKDMTTADVINASDEVIAFFDMATPDRSAVSQINKIKAAIGDKPLRIVWMPSNLAVDQKMFPKDRQSFGMRMYEAFGNMGNVSVEKYHPGAVNKALSGLPLKMLAGGGALKSNEMAIVGEAGPELLVPSGSGGFNVIPNKHLRKLVDGAGEVGFKLAEGVRDVTDEEQDDPHRYKHPVTKKVYNSVTEIGLRGKPSPDIAPYYGNVGTMAHYFAAQNLGAQYGIDVSHVEKPELTPALDQKGILHSVEEQIATAGKVADKFLMYTKKLGFVPELIERRMVDDVREYSGTLDIAGYIRDELGNLVPVIADFKSSSQFNKGKWGEQIAGYAGFFENGVKGFVINVRRDLARMEATEVDLVKGWERFSESLDIYHKSRPSSSDDDLFDSPAFNAAQGFVGNNPKSSFPGPQDYDESVFQVNAIEKAIDKGATGDWLFPSSHPLGIPDKSDKKPSSRCKGVDLCDPTMSRFAGMFRTIKGSGGSGTGDSGGSGGSGGGTGGGDSEPDYEREFAAKYLGNVEHATGLYKRLEGLPALGAPLRARRIKEEYTARVHRASDDDDAQYAPKGYWKLIEKEEQARGRYFRSIRGATTSFLIAQHVMRVFGQTSQVYAKSSESVGKGLGFVMDMFLMPLVPIIRPLVSGAIAFGNVIRTMGPIPLIAGALLTVGLAVRKLRKNAEEAAVIPALLNRMSDGIDRMGQSIANFLRVVPPVGVPTEPTKHRIIVPLSTNIVEDEEEPSSPKRTKLPRMKFRGGLSTGIIKVPGSGNQDTELALLTPGEMVIPAGTAKKIRGYADGGIVGGAAGLVGGITSAYSSILSSDIGMSVISGLSMVSKTMGSLMAPMAPALAGGAIAGKGWYMVKNAVDRMRSSNESINGGGFGALRTMAAAQLVGMIGGLAPLLPIAGAILGLYAWSQGFGAMAGGVLRGIKSVLDLTKDFVKGILDRLKGMWDWFKELFKPKELKGDETLKSDGRKRLPDEKLKSAEEERRRRVREKYEEERRRGEVKYDEITGEEMPDTKKKGLIQRIGEKWAAITTKYPTLEGVPGMTALGGVIGAAESKDPMDWVKGAALGGAGQFVFNMGTKLLGPTLMGSIGGAIAPGFAQTIADSQTSGEGPLSLSNYVPGMKGNAMVNKDISAAMSLVFGAMTGGFAMDPKMIGGDSMNKYLDIRYKDLTGMEAPSDANDSLLTQILNALLGLKENTKTPTINQNSFIVQNDNEQAMFERVAQYMAQKGGTAGAQRSF